jgi:hypothetical protein
VAKTKTLAQIRLSVQTEGSYENSSDITGAVLNDYINKALVRGREILVKAWRDYFTVAGTPFTVVSGTPSYALPTDFEHLRKVEISTDGGSRWHKLSPVDLDDTERHQSPTSRRYRYRLQGGTTPLALHPTPSAGTDQIRVWYIPYATELVNDSDTITINVDAEYELYVALALRKCRIREDLDTVQADATIADCTRRLTDMADERDADEPFYLGDRRDDYCEEW